jgi:hypothetical protein
MIALNRFSSESLGFSQGGNSTGACVVISLLISKRHIEATRVTPEDVRGILDEASIIAPLVRNEHDDIDGYGDIGFPDALGYMNTNRIMPTSIVCSDEAHGNIFNNELLRLMNKLASLTVNASVGKFIWSIYLICLLCLIYLTQLQSSISMHIMLPY